MSYRNWHVGMKVAFISSNDRAGGGYGDEIVPETGGVYTIRELAIKHDCPVLRLVEIVNQPRSYTTDEGVQITEIWFACHHFRPVQTRKTDISVFTAMLDKPRVPA